MSIFKVRSCNSGYLSVAEGAGLPHKKETTMSVTSFQRRERDSLPAVLIRRGTPGTLRYNGIQDCRIQPFNIK